MKSILFMFIAAAFLQQVEAMASPVPVLSSSPKRRACNFFLWDASSALLYRWCKHLMRDCVYEGKGGHRFIRIPPGSILQLLHPITRYSTDRCVFCGGSFHDHLELWWSKKHLYKPFDLHLDTILEKGVVKTTVAPPRRRKGKYNKGIAPAITSTEYVFHRKYVQEESTEEIETRLKQKRSNEMPEWEERRIGPVRYTIPFPRQFSISALVIREIVARGVDFLIALEQYDNVKEQNKSQPLPIPSLFL